MSTSILEEKLRVVPQRLLLTLAAFAFGILVIAFLAAWFLPSGPQRGPFTGTVREGATFASGFGAWILGMQGLFYQHLQRAVLALNDAGIGRWLLLSLSFAYGVLHAAGPGHGKAVIAGYLVADERALVKGSLLSLAAALLQACVAIALVGVGFVLFKSTAATMSRMTAAIETVSFVAMLLLGLAVAWRKAGRLIAMRGAASGMRTLVAPPCDHAHLPEPAELDRIKTWREWAGVVLAAGIRPCSGAILILVFCLSQGVLWAGVAATLAMALGTALTTSLIAALAVFAKVFALRLAAGRGSAGALAFSLLELLAAAFVASLGACLLLGLTLSSPAGA